MPESLNSEISEIYYQNICKTCFHLFKNHFPWTFDCLPSTMSLFFATSTHWSSCCLPVTWIFTSWKFSNSSVPSDHKFSPQMSASFNSNLLNSSFVFAPILTLFFLFKFFWYSYCWNDWEKSLNFLQCCFFMLKRRKKKKWEQGIPC